MPQGLLAALWDNELHDADVHKLHELARRRVPVAALSELDVARADASRRRSEILPRAGIGDELRRVLRAGGVVWGCFALYRGPASARSRGTSGSSLGRDRGGRRRRAAAQPLHRAGARAVATGSAAASAAPALPARAAAPIAGAPSPGLALVRPDARVVAATDEARRIMALLPGAPGADPARGHVRRLAARIRARPRAPDGRSVDRNPRRVDAGRLVR